MIIKPNRTKGIKAAYEDVRIEFNSGNRQIAIENNNKAVEMGTLK
jgi:hypothetical protein